MKETKFYCDICGKELITYYYGLNLKNLTGITAVTWKGEFKSSFDVCSIDCLRIWCNTTETKKEVK